MSIAQAPTIRLIVFALGLCNPSILPSLQAQDSAPSSHLNFNDNVNGDIIVNEVRVPHGGEATYTYYETLGWRGSAAGYAGIQAHPDGHNFIFSIWDNDAHTAPIQALYTGHGTTATPFGGEGTGLKSWNFDLGWQTGVWHTLVARSWPIANDHTCFAFWVKRGDDQLWYHLVTMDVAAPHAEFEGKTDVFIEDWLTSGAESREINVRQGWKRNSSGQWIAFSSGRYSVNSIDLIAGNRSYNYRTNWDGGTKIDATGDILLYDLWRCQHSSYNNQSLNP